MKYYGKVGYAIPEEVDQDVWEDRIVEHSYVGDVLRNSKHWESTEGLNDNMNINNTISIVGDPYAFEHFSTIKYVSWMGSLWKVKSVEIQRPRLILSIGGIYNGPKGP